MSAILSTNILSLDPSGNFHEGKGTTGWNLILVDEKHKRGKPISVGQIRAADYESEFDYQQAHKKLIETLQPGYVAMEDFRLYKDKAVHQTNSQMPTSKLIGILENYLNEQGIPNKLIPAARSKTRWTDERLERIGYITNSKNRWYCAGVQITRHIKDSLRIGAYCVHFVLPKEK